TRTFGVSRTTVSSWIKKKEFSFLLCIQPWSSPTQQIPLLRRWNWTNCGRLSSKKHATSGCGIALCRKIRQVVAYARGDRSKKTCLRLWEAIASVYRQGQCFTD